MRKKIAEPPSFSTCCTLTLQGLQKEQPSRVCGLVQEAFMRKELNSIAEYKKPSSDAFASIARSFGEANNRFQALVVESVRHAVEI